MTNKTESFITSMVRRQVRSETAHLEFTLIELNDTLTRVMLELSELRNIILDSIEKPKKDSHLL